MRVSLLVCVSVAKARYSNDILYKKLDDIGSGVGVNFPRLKASDKEKIFVSQIYLLPLLTFYLPSTDITFHMQSYSYICPNIVCEE